MDNAKTNEIKDTVREFFFQDNPEANIDMSERMVSAGTGAFITVKGISNIFSNPRLALIELAAGGLLLYRGITGYCPIAAMLENEATPSKQESELQGVSDTKDTNPSIGSTGEEGWTGMI